MNSLKPISFVETTPIANAVLLKSEIPLPGVLVLDNAQ